ncbi:MAG: DUF302 domain-containing protein [Thioalkalispiraceae bacterium]
MSRIFKFILTLLLLSLSGLLQAEDLLMLRSSQPFPETMSNLQNTIKHHGYTVSRVQRVDIGLTKMGYKTDKYRVVFFGKHDELVKITNTHPELAAYLPLKIAIFSEDTETLLVTTNPLKYGEMFKNESLKKYFTQWSKDITAILNDMRNFDDDQ